MAGAGDGCALRKESVKASRPPMNCWATDLRYGFVVCRTQLEQDWVNTPDAVAKMNMEVRMMKERCKEAPPQKPVRRPRDGNTGKRVENLDKNGDATIVVPVLL
ncbi:hypothetical protein QIS74_08406 [Colletotrichum tabaci]|uniref:Uncharacterized protein n=1 Tax=Colletotrichum tabaci TaxID=1209068 RepID=A0AAV9T965_9PEZI